MIEEVIRKKGAVTLIDVIVAPGSRKRGISGVDEWRKRLVVSVKAKPVEGRANAAIVRFFSEIFGVPTKGVRIVSGQKTSQKTLEVEKDIEDVTAVLQNILGQD